MAAPVRMGLVLAADSAVLSICFYGTGAEHHMASHYRGRSRPATNTFNLNSLKPVLFLRARRAELTPFPLKIPTIKSSDTMIYKPSCMFRRISVSTLPRVITHNKIGPILNARVY